MGSEVSVYGHLLAGHTVNNYSARVFGADAGKDASVDSSGVHMFDLLYPASYVRSEASRLGEDESTIRNRMIKHYKNLVIFSHKNNFKVGNQRLALGQEIFHDINGAKTIFHNDWERKNL